MALCEADQCVVICSRDLRARSRAEVLAAHGFLQRTDQQFHWHNQGYWQFRRFPGHHAELAPPQGDRWRERRDAVASGITIHALTGSDITEDAWDAFFDFYMETGSRKWGRPYLTRAFFSLIGETMSRDVLLVMARRNGRWIAGAINFIGSDALFGRNWGARSSITRSCISRSAGWPGDRLSRLGGACRTVEAGAQGEHKIARGYLPQTTYSAHYIADPDLRRAISDAISGASAPMWRKRGASSPGAGRFAKPAEPS